MLIEQAIRNHAVNSPLKVALINGEITVTYAELWSRILNAASYFQEKGLGGGERIVLSASKSLDFVYVYFGAHMAGLVCVPIDPETNQTRLNRIIECAQPSLFVGTLKNSEGLEVLPFTDITSEKEADCPFPENSAIADLLFTTGTTGLPKGVALSFKNQAAAAENINTFIENTSDDVELLALPISHSFGLGRLRCVLSKGATLVLLGSFAAMKKFYKEIERCGVTGFGMVPSSLAYITKMSGDKIGEFASQLKYIEIGSAFMPLSDKKLLMELLPSTRICMHYGLTEASRSAFINFYNDVEHLDSIGKPSPNTEIAFFNEEGQPVPENEEGELCVKGGHVCDSYWGQTKEVFAKDFNGEYFKTGDWGYADSKGYLYLKSRKKEMINVGGKKVSPIEVEEALNTLEGVGESACIGVPDPVYGEVVKAFIVGTLTAEDDQRIIKEMMGLVENYKVPVFIEHIDSIPKTASGKIQRLLLKN